MQTELAIAECVWKRIGGKWFVGLLMASFIVLFITTTMDGPDPATTLNNNCEQSFTIIGLISCILTLVISATELPRDINGRIIMVLLSRPIGRFQVVIGKWLGCLFVGAFFTIATSAFTILTLWFSGLTPNMSILSVALTTLLKIILIGSAGILFSTGLSEIPTMAFTIVYTGFGFFIPMITGLLDKAEIPGIGKYALSSIAYVAPNINGGFRPPITPLSLWLQGSTAKVSSLDLSDTLMGAANLAPVGWSSLILSTLYTSAYALALLGLSILFFRKRVLA